MKKLIDLIRQNWLFFLLVTLVGLALRLFFVFRFPHIAGDTYIYGDIALNWLNHGIYGLTEADFVRPTLIRLPGYPGFLAAVFSVFGQEHYTAVLIVQAFIDTNTCLVIAALALELMNARAARAAYLLAAMCPFTAMYTAAPLSETLAICCVAHTLYYGVRGIKSLESSEPVLWPWLLTGMWASVGIYMRPDDGIILLPLAFVLLAFLFRPAKRRQTLLAGILLAVISLGPLAPWAARNWLVFHMWQPLASRYANDPGEFVARGFNHWVKTWLVDYVSVEDVYWSVPGDPIDPQAIPERAFDTRPEYERTLQLISQYNQQLRIDPKLDAEFEQVARLRVEHNPLRYGIWLPALRMTDMWLRPRTELLPMSTRWWDFNEHKRDSLFALGWAILNCLYILAAVGGWMRWRLGLAGAMAIAFILLRTIFLSTLENPEPRYVLECFPALLALAGGAFARFAQESPPPSATPPSVQ